MPIPALSIPVSVAPTLAQELSTDYFMNDPTGRMISLAVIVVVGLVVLYFALKSMRWAAARMWPVLGAAVVIALLYYGAMALMGGGPVVWLVAGVVAFGCLVGFALIFTRA